MRRIGRLALAGLMPLLASCEAGAERARGRTRASGTRATPADVYGDPLPEGAVARLGTIRFRHGGRVGALAYTPDGKRIVSGSGDGLVRVWDLEGRLIRKMAGHEGNVFSVAVSKDGKRIVSGAKDGTVRIWDAETGGEVRRLAGHGSAVRSVAISSDGRRIVSGGMDKTVRIWDAETGDSLKTIEAHAAAVLGVAFAPDGKTFASGSGDATIRIWDLEGNEVRKLEGHTARVRAIAYSPDGRFLASQSLDKTVRLWNPETAAEIAKTEGTEKEGGAVAWGWLPSQAVMLRLWCFGRSDTLQGWDFKPSRPGFSASRHVIQGAGGVVALATSPWPPWADPALTVGSWDKTIRRLPSEVGPLGPDPAGHAWNVNALAFSRDGTSLVSGGGDLTVRLWDVAKARQVRVFEGHKKGVRAVSFSEDEKTILSADSLGNRLAWERDTGKPVALPGEEKPAAEGEAPAGGEAEPAPDPKARPPAEATSPDGRLLAKGETDGTVRLLEAAAGTEVRVLKGHTARVNALAFSADGKTLASGGEDTTILLWPVASVLESPVPLGP